MRDFDDHDWDDEDQDDDTTDECPGCGAWIYDDVARCPSCGRYLSREDTPRGKPWWVVAGAVVCLAMMFWWAMHP